MAESFTQSVVAEEEPFDPEFSSKPQKHIQVKLSCPSPLPVENDKNRKLALTANTLESYKSQTDSDLRDKTNCRDLLLLVELGEAILKIPHCRRETNINIHQSTHKTVCTPAMSVVS